MPKNSRRIDSRRGLNDCLPMSKRCLACFIILLLLLKAVEPAMADLPFGFDTTPGQLPKSIVPRHYTVEIRPDLEKLTTQGRIGVQFEVLKPTSEIVLNALDLEITAAKLEGKADLALKPVLDAAKQTLTFKLPHELKRGHYVLYVEFTGHITEQAEGFFYVRYAAPSGKKIMLATEMEPADARRMFPCWDEPVFRATFDLTVTLPEKFKAVSNMPIEREINAAGWKKVSFARTPSMPSYLVVLVAGELEEIAAESEGVQLRVITTEGKREQGRYALAAAKELLAYYDDYFGIKYPLPKLDLIAIPGGFDGAMENWGGITYNENVLLYNPKTSSPQTQRDIFVTVAHEMSHQWFGNLVTMAWWDNLWLNEGFATWMEVKATDHFNPDWQMWLSAASDKSAVMSGDAHSTTHAIQQSVENESEANDAFDSITYQKGGAFLRMLEDYLGPDAFRRGVHRYLATHELSNATTADLWDALQKTSGQPIRAIANSWTVQPGLPVVIVKADCVNGKQVVSLEQQRFTVQDPHAEPLRWKIPVTLATAAHPTDDSKLLLTNRSASFTLPDCAGIPKANAGDHGYYRTQYDPALAEKLQRTVNEWPPADRLNLLNDSWALVEAQRASATNYFALVAALKDESTFAIWDQIISTLFLVDALERNLPGQAALRQYACRLLQPPFQRLGWQSKPGEPPNDAMLRDKLIGALGHFGDQAVIAEAETRFDHFLKHPESLPPALRPAVLKLAGRYSDKNVYGQIHELARQTADTEQRQLYYHSLCGALDPELAKTTLAISLTDELVPQEATDLVINVADLGEHPELAWDFAAKHIQELLAKVDPFDRDNYVPSILATFSDPIRADELESYVKNHISFDALVKARQTSEEIRFKSMLKEHQIPEIDQWLKTQPTNPK